MNENDLNKISLSCFLKLNTIRKYNSNQKFVRRLVKFHVSYFMKYIKDEITIGIHIKITKVK